MKNNSFSSRLIRVLVCSVPMLHPLFAADESAISSSSKTPPPNPSARQIGERVASQVMRLKDFPPNYITDLQLEALLALGDATKESKYLRFVQDAMARRNMPPGYRHPWRSQFYTSISFDLLIRTGDRSYISPFVEESLVYRDAVIRSFDGTVSAYFSDYDHNHAPLVSTRSGATYVKREWTPVLLDQLQEYASRMAKAGCLSGDHEFIQEAITQIELMHAALRDTKTGLWSHARGFVDSEKSLTETKWGRGQAWALRGLVETLTYLPPEGTEAGRVEKILKELGGSLIRYQDASGFWHQVVDRADSYQETSATGLISHYLARAVQEGFLPKVPYRKAARNAFEAIATRRVSIDGDVYGGSTITPPLPSTIDYMERKTAVNDGHAVAATILAAAGQIALDAASGDSGGTGGHSAVCVQSQE